MRMQVLSAAHTKRPSLWITYAWKDNVEGDFQYLVSELTSLRITVRYDKVALVPGHRLWEQIADQIIHPDLTGWAYLVTPASLASEACREELAYALDRALHARGGAFPLMGLLHAVRVEDVPPALRVRLCVSLASPTWREEILAGLEGRAPRVPTGPQTKYVWAVREDYYGDGAHTAIEVRPRFGEVVFWRFALPLTGPQPVHWGWGPAGSSSFSGNMRSEIISHGGQVDGEDVSWFGAGDPLSPGISAYCVFERSVPRFIAFGRSEQEYGPPGEMEVFRPA